MKKKIICALLAIVMIIGSVSILASCGDTEDPTPGPDDGECTEHVDENEDYKCDVCGKSTVKKHSKHTDENGDGKCDVPGCTKKPNDTTTSVGTTGEVNWETVDFIYQMTSHDTSDLSSTCARYLAGEWKGTLDNIDKAITKRNNAALDFANVGEITYLYRPNTEAYGWGKVAEVIMTEVSSLDSTDLPDMYCDQVYGMVAASLQGCFANLYGTVRGNGQNFFPFNEFKEYYYKGNFDEETQGGGYMYEYMTTLTLSKNKMYLLASDYYTDLVRAFYITPVNIKLLEDCDPAITGDRIGDGDGITIDDFYELVKAREWTYTKVAEYSKDIYSDDANPGRIDMADTLGFAITSMGGLPSSGIIYSTACTIINRELDPSIDDFKYSYPKDNEKLFTLFDKIADLVAQEGVYVVGGSAEDLAYNPEHALRSIAARFADNKILFGGVCLLGGLENSEYQAMKENGKGFGVVPVPLYADDIEDEYLTQIHNEGRIGAISVKTQKFEQCTAFLHYQSINSSKILDDYYDYKLQYDIVDAAPSTVYMMQYIRNHVRSAFDKTFEDAMGAFYEKSENRWHDILMRNRFSIDLRQRYNELYDVKEGDLENLVKYFDGLPD